MKRTITYEIEREDKHPLTDDEKSWLATTCEMKIVHKLFDGLTHGHLQEEMFNIKYLGEWELEEE